MTAPAATPLPATASSAPPFRARRRGTIVAFYISATDTQAGDDAFPRPAQQRRARAGVRGHVWRQQSQRQFRRLPSMDHADERQSLDPTLRLEQRGPRLHDRVRQPRHLQRSGAVSPAAPTTRTSIPPTAISAITSGFSPTMTSSWARPRSTRSTSPATAPGDDASLQREQIANTFLRALGVPWLNRRIMSRSTSTATAGARSWKMPKRPTPTW